MKRKLALRFMLPTVLVVVPVMLLFGWVTDRTLETEVSSRANQEAASQVDRVEASLQTIDNLSSEQIQSAMNVLKREGGQTGEPAVRGTASVVGNSVAQLWLGGTAQDNDFTLVDRIKTLTSCTATLFVKQDNSFIRISTNVKKPDGTRAIGTPLAPTGPAYAALSKGQAFYGVTEILGSPYMTGYEPMRDKSGQIVGAWYVGIPLTAIAEVGKGIGSTKILNNGYAALLKSSGKVVFKPEQVSEAEILQRFQHPNEGHWKVFSRSFERWGYTLLATYPESDVTSKLRRMQANVLVCSILLSLLVLLAEYILVTRLVVKPLEHLSTRMKNADLNTLLNEDRDDEIGVLAKNFAQFVGNIRETLMAVAFTSEAIASASKQISSGSGQTAKGAGEQRDQVAQIAAAIQEMSATVGEVSENSHRAADCARRATESAREGGAVVDDTMNAMQNIGNSVRSVAEEVQELGSRSKQIGSIMGVISEIASQTNLLALNAAIEAARAGEHGRGFAVVAGEVRRLAERTSGATKEIAEMIEGIQSETEVVVGKMGSRTGEVEKGMMRTSQTGESIQHIIRLSEETGAMIAQIAAATTQQAAATDEVNSSIEQINRVAADSAETAQQSSHACAQLSQHASDLQQLLHRFQLNETGH